MEFQVGDTVMYRDHTNQKWKGPSTILSIDPPVDLDKYPYQIKANGCWYAQVKVVETKPTHLTSFDGVTVGTKLKIREDLKEGQYRMWVNSHMEKMAGETVTVEHLGAKFLNVKEISFGWSPDMFECIVTDTEDMIDKRYTIPENDFV